MSFRTLQNNNASQFVANDIVYIVYSKREVVPTDDTFPSNFAPSEMKIKGVYNYRPTFFELNDEFEIVGPFQIQRKPTIFDPVMPPRRLSSIPNPPFPMPRNDLE
jgi:hypothetical protein